MQDSLPSPWKEFLHELDDRLSQPVQLHCIGGFAAVIAYQLPRSTNDLDYFTLTPTKSVHEIQELAGEGSSLAVKHGVHTHHAAVASLPDGYEERLRELYPRRFKNIRLFVLDPYDLVLSKLSRNAERDRQDVAHLAKTQKLNPNILKERYEKELAVTLIGPKTQHDKTLAFWLEAYFRPMQEM